MVMVRMFSQLHGVNISMVQQRSVATRSCCPRPENAEALRLPWPWSPLGPELRHQGKGDELEMIGVPVSPLVCNQTPNKGKTKGS